MHMITFSKIMISTSCVLRSGWTTLNDVQINQLESLLDRKDLEKLCVLFLHVTKTENVFFKYARSSRSMMEQSRSGRLLSGLNHLPAWCWLKRLVENSMKPFVRGVKDVDVLTMYQGVMLQLAST